MRRLGALLLLLGAVPARAQPPEPASYALFRLDPLGIEPQIVDQLERILRVELEHVIGRPLPAREKVEKVAAQNPKLAACTANPECLVPLAKALSATRIIAGNVGGLADSYVVNLKLVDRDGRELRRVNVNLRGSPEELIDEIRVAAYRLVAPEKLVGSVALLSDVPGATVNLDGRAVGQTPLPGPLADLSVGIHHVAVTRDGFSAVEEDVPVHFQKTTQMVVHQKAVSEAAKRAERRRMGEAPVYTRWWFWTAMAVSAIATGVVIGFVDSAAAGRRLHEGHLPVKRVCALAVLLAAPALWAAPPVRVAVMPLRDVGLGAEAVAELEHAVVEAVAVLPGFSVANLTSAGRLSAPKGSTLESAATRAQSLARETGANRALLIDVARLGDGQVVYLQRIDPKNGQSLGSTTASLSTSSPPSAADQSALRGAVVRVLDPDRFCGRLALKLDVKGAEVQVDGRPLSGDVVAPHRACGRHARAARNAPRLPRLHALHRRRLRRDRVARGAAGRLSAQRGRDGRAAAARRGAGGDEAAALVPLLVGAEPIGRSPYRPDCRHHHWHPPRVDLRPFALLSVQARSLARSAAVPPLG